MVWEQLSQLSEDRRVEAWQLNAESHRISPPHLGAQVRATAPPIARLMGPFGPSIPTPA